MPVKVKTATLVKSDAINTAYGFDWGPICIERWFNDGKNRVFGITAGKNKLTIRVSKTGSTVRIWKNNKELR